MTTTHRQNGKWTSIRHQSTLLSVLLFVQSCLLLPCTLPAAEPLNVLLICVDDLRPELNCYGADYIQSPHIDSLASRGALFTKHYVQAPTCGASRYALLTGRYGGASNNALFTRAKEIRDGKQFSPPSMPAWFRQNGYRTVSVGKVSHHPGGLGGPDWNEPSEVEMPQAWDTQLLEAGAWKHPRGWMHGLAHGEIRKNASQMDVYQSVEGEDSIYPDGASIETAVQQLDQLTASDSPFFLAVGILRPHLPFGAPAKYFEPYKDAELPTIKAFEKPDGKTTWHRSGEFMKYNRWGRNPNQDRDFAELVRKHYAACVSYADAQVGKLISRLEESGALDKTVIVLWGDHGWHLGEHAIWGKHSLFEESLRSPLIVCLPRDSTPRIVDSVVESRDVFPTLCLLSGIETPDGLNGQVIVSPNKPNVPIRSDGIAISYTRSARTIRTERHRLIAHNDGFLELYNHEVDANEEHNVAMTEPQNAQKLLKLMNQEWLQK
ncbi:MAG: sulfatase [Pirellulaceae bacterium]